MTLTDAAMQADLVSQVGETDAGTLMATVAIKWAMWAFKAAQSPELHWAYVKRALIDTARGEVRQQIAVTLPGQQSLALQQKALALATMHEEIGKEITALEKQFGASRPPAIGVITRTEPLTPADVLAAPVSVPLDANAPWLTGSPYYRTGRRYGP